MAGYVWPNSPWGPPPAEPFNGVNTEAGFSKTAGASLCFTPLHPIAAVSPSTAAGGGLITVNNQSGTAIAGKRGS